MDECLSARLLIYGGYRSTGNKKAEAYKPDAVRVHMYSAGRANEEGVVFV